MDTARIPMPTLPPATTNGKREWPCKYCRFVIGHTDGPDLYFGAHLTPGNPLSVKVQCTNCLRHNQWHSTREGTPLTARNGKGVDAKRDM